MIPAYVPRHEVPDCARCTTDDRGAVRGYVRGDRPAVWLCAPCAVALGYGVHEVAHTPAPVGSRANERRPAPDPEPAPGLRPAWAGRDASNIYGGRGDD